MRFNKILVPVAGTPADNGALDLACTLAKTKFRPGITALHVIPVDRSLPLEAEVEAEVAHADAIMSEATRRIEKNGCAAEMDIIQAREVGPAIVQVAQENFVVDARNRTSWRKHKDDIVAEDISGYVG